MAIERFPNGSMEPGVGSIAITPHDTNMLSKRIRAITVGTAGGTIAWTGWDDVENTTGPLPVGTHPMYAKRIKAAGTTATGLTGWI